MVEIFFIEVWNILLELSPALLAGLLLAGVLHVVLPAGLIHRTMSKPGLGSTLKAVLAGVPMPLCSCGVLPTALGLRREGASNGATTGFLISTPQTGVDSILVSAAFLGWPFALFKLGAAFVTGIIGGLIADRVAPQNQDPITPRVPSGEKQTLHGFIYEVVHYAIFDLYAAIDKWIIGGVFVAALITVLTPADFFEQLSWAQGMGGMLIMLAISIPLYICTTGSVPIAASFVAAGMPTGTALVFLMAGPATNVATIAAIYRALGPRLLATYLGTVIVMSIGFGMGFDFILTDVQAVPQHEHGSNWLGVSSAILVLALSVLLLLQPILSKPEPTGDSAMGITIKVDGMTCQHCVANVKSALEALEAVSIATPDLGQAQVVIEGDDLDEALLKATIASAGYEVK